MVFTPRLFFSSPKTRGMVFTPRLFSSFLGPAGGLFFSSLLLLLGPAGGLFSSSLPFSRDPREDSSPRLVSSPRTRGRTLLSLCISSQTRREDSSLRCASFSDPGERLIASLCLSGPGEETITRR